MSSESYIVEVTPFSKSIRSNSLSYFSSNKVSPGSIVTVSLRNKDIKGLVIDVKSVEDLKTELRQSDYSLKKIKGISKNILFSEEFMIAAKETSEYFATSSGSIIQALLPNNILDNIQKLNKAKIEEETNDGGTDVLKNITPETEHPKFILQAPDKDRYSEYKSIIRGQFAKNKSVLFCVPTVEDGNYAQEALSRGIETHTFVLNSSLNKTETINTWNEIITRNKPSLVIVTGGFVGIPVSDLGTIIVDRESSNAYKTQQRPYFDLRFFFEEYASALQADFILGDLMLRAETLWRYDQHEFTEFTPIKFRSITDANQKIIDTKDTEETEGNNNFVSKSLAHLIDEAILNSEHSFLLVNRKGLSPLIVCGDCGDVVKCEHCSSPITLHGKDATSNSNYFRCHTCGHTRSAGELCTKCDSWRLVTLGIGIEKIESEIKKRHPDTKVFVLNKDEAKTASKAQKIAKEFYDSPSAVIIGTEMALLYLHEEIENVAVVSIDSMFALPDFRIRERILNILLRTRALASQNFLIQTRNSTDPIFKNITEGNLTDFYRSEFIDRKKFNYPPFSLIIKISLAAKTAAQIEKQFAEVEKLLAPREIVTYPAFTETVRGQKIVHGMIKLPHEEWPDCYLIERLKQLPPQFKVQIDAESVL